MAEPASIDTVFASAISLLQVLQRFHRQSSDVRELQDQLRALVTVLLLLINGADHVVEIYDQLKHPLLRCGEGCNYLKRLMSESTTKAGDLSWKTVFRDTKYMLSAYTSTFMIGFAGENFQKAIITPGVIRNYRQLIQYTISDLNESEEWFGDLSPSEIDKNAFLSICTNCSNSSYILQPTTIEVVKETQGVSATQPSEMVFCTAKEAFGDTLDWERNLQACFYTFKDKFESAVNSLPDTSNAEDIVKHFEHLKQRSGTQQRIKVVGEDLTKPDQILDLCGVLLFYDINYSI